MTDSNNSASHLLQNDAMPFSHRPQSSSSTASTSAVLSPEQIATYLRDGVLVVPNILTSTELADSMHGLQETLRRYDVDSSDLEQTAKHLRKLSTTNGSGGVLDIFYEQWKINTIATHEKLFAVTTELWKAAYMNTESDFESAATNTDGIGKNCDDDNDNDDGAGGKEEDGTTSDDDIRSNVKWHPYGSFDATKGYMYLDRIGYRIPTQLAEEIGRQHPDEDTNTTASGNISSSRRRKQQKAIQRSLTPHLDCCPDTYWSATGKKKWRPIQCFVSLSDTMLPNHGGFEAACGMHRDFYTWSKTRPHTKIPMRRKKQQQSKPKKQKNQPSTNKSNDPAGNNTTNKEEQQYSSFPAPCIGEYTHMRPKEDADILRRIQHVPVPAGAAVFWDNRIGHANAYTHIGTEPRCVVYCSFLPDIPLNRIYAYNQLQNWRHGCINPTDQWQETQQSCIPSTTDKKEKTPASYSSGSVATNTETVENCSNDTIVNGERCDENSDEKQQQHAQYNTACHPDEVLQTDFQRRLAGYGIVVL